MMNEAEQVRLENIADTKHEIFALLKQRYSPRTFRNDKIEEEHLKQLFEAVRWSASSNNLQPWRFIYGIKGTDGYESIFNCLSDFNKSWATNAPLLILTAYKEKKDNGDENFHALHDLGLCLGNMTVQAQYMGIGMHHMAGVDWKKAEDVFNLPDEFHVSTVIALGYYGGDLDKLSDKLQKQETERRTRIPLDEFAFDGKWKNG